MIKKELKINYLDVESLESYQGNSRRHTSDQVDQVAASIDRFGFTAPILVRGTMIVAGHARWAAAKKLHMAQVPCVDLDGLTDDEVRAYVIADNKLALNASWDEDILKAEIEALCAVGFDMDLTGFDFQEVEKILDDEEKRKRPDRKAVELPTGMWEIVVTCDDEAHQEAVYNQLMGLGLKVRVLGC